MIESDNKIRLLSYFIAVLFLYNSFAYVLLYFPVKLIIKEITEKSVNEKKIKSEDLSLIAFNISDLKQNKYDFIWEKPDREFRFNGKMYDIEDKLISGDTVYYKVYYDHNENILDEIFALFYSNTRKDEAQNPVQRIQLIGIYSEEIGVVFSKSNDEILSNIPLQKNESGLLNNFPDIPTPPPRLIVL